MIDNQVPFSGHFHACDQQGCLIQSDPLDEATLKRLKSGQTLELMVQDQVQNKVIFSIPLDGLTKGLSGPPTSQAQLAEHQKKLKEEFIKYTKKYAKTQQQQH